MKILIVTGIFPPDHGGPASYVPAIAKSLSASDLNVVGLLTLSDSFHGDDNKYPYPVIRIIRAQNKLLRLIKTILTIKKLSNKADLVYVNGLVFEAIIALKILSKKCVVIKVVGDLAWEKTQASENSIGIEEFQKKYISPKIALWRKLQSWYINRSDAIITPSHYLKKIILGWGVGHQKIHVVHNAVEKPRGLDSQNLKKYDVVAVGRLIPLKCFDRLIKVCSSNEYRLLIVGDGPQRAYLESLAISCGARVTFSGNLPKEDVFSSIAASKILVLNSTHEGFPHVVLEAKQVGVPVVATRVGGVPELISDEVDGVMIDPMRDDQLSAAIKHLLTDDHAYNSIRQAGLNQVKNFSWDVLVDNTKKILLENSQRYRKLS